MSVNGKDNSNGRALDVEHELPSAENEQQAAEAGASENQPAQPDARISALEADLERLSGERNALFDRLARLQAEFENYRKRQARENQEFREFALEQALKSLLPIVDSFDRALGAPEGPEFRSGVELINRQLHDALAKLGVEPIAAEGRQFDPSVHQAVQMVETSEAPHNHVVEELQRGYKLKDRLLRPAMVRVASNPNE